VVFCSSVIGYISENIRIYSQRYSRQLSMYKLSLFLLTTNHGGILRHKSQAHASLKKALFQTISYS
jgi:hypothetical protein